MLLLGKGKRVESKPERHDGSRTGAAQSLAWNLPSLHSRKEKQPIMEKKLTNIDVNKLAQKLSGLFHKYTNVLCLAFPGHSRHSFAVCHERAHST
jgi:hypothetical protein